MKNLKKVLAIALALVMVFSFAVTAFADDGYDITINGADGHTFKAYQILTGTVTGTKGDKSLGDPAWGDDVDSSALVTAFNKEFAPDSIATAKDLVEFLSKKGDDSDVAIKFAKVAAACVNGSGSDLTGLDAGYYLVIDESDLDGEHDAYSRYILQVVNDVEVDAKISYPDVEKDVKDYNDSTSTDGTWGKSADYDIGDDVEFRLTGTIPNTTGYETYYYAFHDVMQDTFGTAKDFVVTVGGVELDEEYYEIVTCSQEEHTGEEEDCTLTDGCTFEVVIKNLIDAIDSVKENVEPAYDSDLGVVVEYTAELLENAIHYNPGQVNTVELEFSNDPNYTTDGDGEPGDEPGDEPENPPTGRTRPKTVRVFTYDVTVTKVDGDTKADLDGAKFKLEKEVNGKWVLVKEIYLEKDNVFEFKGLDDGKYRLTETEAPAGYNKLVDPIEFEVSARHSVTETTVSIVDDEIIKITNGSIATTIENNKGSQLPSTGGIGTTIFYVVGGFIVLAAVVLLITKRRMSNAD